MSAAVTADGVHVFVLRVSGLAKLGSGPHVTMMGELATPSDAMKAVSGVPASLILTAHCAVVAVHPRQFVLVEAVSLAVLPDPPITSPSVVDESECMRVGGLWIPKHG